MTRTIRTASALALIVLLLASAGCVRVELNNSGPSGSNVTERVELQGAKRVDATIKLGVGELSIGPGAEGLMDAQFDYSHVSWKPGIDYTVDGDQGTLKVTQPEVDLPTLGGTNRNSWGILLNQDVPMDLTVELGAGEGTLLLGDLDLEDLTVQMGVGDTTIDLVGAATHDLDATIEGGVGELTLKVPAGVGVRLVGFRDGIGNYSAPGFEMDGDTLVNDEWATASTKYDIVLRRGVGDVNVETVD